MCHAGLTPPINCSNGVRPRCSASCKCRPEKNLQACCGKHSSNPSCASCGRDRSCHTFADCCPSVRHHVYLHASDGWNRKSNACFDGFDECLLPIVNIRRTRLARLVKGISLAILSQTVAAVSAIASIFMPLAGGIGGVSLVLSGSPHGYHDP